MYVPLPPSLSPNAVHQTDRVCQDTFIEYVIQVIFHEAELKQISHLQKLLLGQLRQRRRLLSNAFPVYV